MRPAVRGPDRPGGSAGLDDNDEEDGETMEQWLEWARGPVFRFAFALMVLGILRLLVLNVLNIRAMLRQASDRNIPAGALMRETLRWLFPVNRVARRRLVFTVVSIVFHVAVIVTPIFLVAHIRLWERSLGIAWPGLDPTAADVLTLAAVAAALILFIERAAARVTRSLSRFQDFALPILIALPFASGFLAMHPSLNPFSYDATMLVHVLSGSLVFILLPFSKLSHAVLFPTTQLVSELGWHFVPESGTRVAAALGKESDSV